MTIAKTIALILFTATIIAVGDATIGSMVNAYQAALDAANAAVTLPTRP